MGHHPRRHRCVRAGVAGARRRAWAEGRFDGQWIAVEAPDVDDEGNPTGTTHTVARDEGIRESSLEKLATLKPVGREDGVHTAGNSSQISDGAAAVLIMTDDKASALGLTPRARIVDTCLVGVDPVLMLTGPIDATQRLLDRSGLSIDDIDTFEINEAFASVVLAWAKETGADLEKTNPNGGAIALGHPLGATGRVLDDEGAQRARAHRRPLRPGVDVLRRRSRHRHPHRTALVLECRSMRAGWSRLHDLMARHVETGEMPGSITLVARHDGAER